ncbi:hypothetical protein HW555_005057, partial [Spodoptera exigua]
IVQWFHQSEVAADQLRNPQKAENVLNLNDVAGVDEIEKTIENLSNLEQGKKRPHKPTVSDLDSFDIDAIRNKINEFYIVRKQVPTLKTLLVELRESFGFNGCRETLSHLLLSNGYEFKNERSLLIERYDISSWRHRFLRTMALKRREGKCLDKVHLQVEAVKHISTGKRYIIVHAGTEKGPVSNSLLVLSTKSKMADYHQDMNAVNFNKLLREKLIPNLNEPSTSHHIVAAKNKRRLKLENIILKSTLKIVENKKFKAVPEKFMFRQDWNQSLHTDDDNLFAESCAVIDLKEPSEESRVILNECTGELTINNENNENETQNIQVKENEGDSHKKIYPLPVITTPTQIKITEPDSFTDDTISLQPTTSRQIEMQISKTIIEPQPSTSKQINPNKTISVVSNIPFSEYLKQKLPDFPQRQGKRQIERTIFALTSNQYVDKIREKQLKKQEEDAAKEERTRLREEKKSQKENDVPNKKPKNKTKKTATNKIINSQDESNKLLENKKNRCVTCCDYCLNPITRRVILCSLCNNFMRIVYHYLTGFIFLRM